MLYVSLFPHLIWCVFKGGGRPSGVPRQESDLLILYMHAIDFVRVYEKGGVSEWVSGSRERRNSEQEKSERGEKIEVQIHNVNITE